MLYVGRTVFVTKSEEFMKRILIVEDNGDINDMINTALTKEGYECTSAFSGTEAVLRLSGEQFDLVILDLMLPGMDGQEVLKKARETTSIPFIVLSAKDELDTKVDLLTLGANDYMTKPFEIKELIARVLVQLRNAPTVNRQELLEYEELSMDLERKVFNVNNNPVALTAQEFKIMELFLRHPGKVFSKNEIYEYAWEDYYVGEDKTVYVHISNIRQKIKKYTERDYIETVWGLGFKL